MTDAVRASIEAVLGPLREVRPVGGGCISPAYRVRTGDGAECFVKTAGRDWPADAFAEEARSLRRLGQAGVLTVPEVHGVSAGWLALEWLEPAAAGVDGWAALGRGLAQLHAVEAPRPGWERDNYIGPLPQPNGAMATWPEFWRARRLEPVVERAATSLDASTVRQLERLCDTLPDLIGPAGAEDGMSLLHGDLWSGNVHMSVRGPALVDPASSFGHREVDLAMASLFGGFPPGFFEAYEAEWPLRPGAARRRHVYQLYYLLVHVVLFGGGYAAGTAAAVRAALD